MRPRSQTPWSSIRGSSASLQIATTIVASVAAARSCELLRAPSGVAGRAQIRWPLPETSHEALAVVEVGFAAHRAELGFARSLSMTTANSSTTQRGRDVADRASRGVRPGGASTKVAPSRVATRPILKWAGGKRSLLPAFQPLLPAGFENMRLVEAFAGGAAVFFGTAAPRALLSDINPALMETYAAVRDDLQGVIAHLADLAARHCTAHYYDVRTRFNQRRFGCSAELAAAFVYLNKTCFNGLYRVNRAGAFNVPAGKQKNPAILDVEGLSAASVRLRSAQLVAASFEQVLAQVAVDDFVYLDPPYVPRSRSSNFAAYAAGGFTDADHERLRDAFVALARRGVRVMLSNSDTPRVRALYRGWDLQQVEAHRSLGCKVATRGAVHEVVVRSYA